MIVDAVTVRDSPMPKKTRFTLSASISSNDPRAVRAPLEAFVGKTAKIENTDDGFKVTGVISGESARDLNRALLTALRRAEKKTRLRADWTSDGVTEKFFDYVPKGTKKVDGST